MERFISACRNPLAKSATTKAIGYATQVPNASATVSEGADRPERSAGKKTFDNRILILRRFKRRFGSESNPSAKVLLFSDMTKYFGKKMRK